MDDPILPKEPSVFFSEVVEAIFGLDAPFPLLPEAFLLVTPMAEVDTTFEDEGLLLFVATEADAGFQDEADANGEDLTAWMHGEV